MLRYYDKAIVGGKHYCEIYCLSTDAKPNNLIANGAFLCEIDTGKVYLFNEDAGAWVEQFTMQG